MLQTIIIRSRFEQENLLKVNLKRCNNNFRIFKKSRNTGNIYTSCHNHAIMKTEVFDVSYQVTVLSWIHTYRLPTTCTPNAF